MANHHTAWSTGKLPLLLAAPALAASLALPPSGRWVVAVAVVIVLGVPHGALDVEIGRTWLRRRFGWGWFGVFSIPYLAFVAAVLVAWHLAPFAILVAFLAATVWHFGVEETGVGGLSALVRGGLPIAVPVLVQPAATAAVLATATGAGDGGMPGWLVGASLLWLIAACIWAWRTGGQGLLLPAALAGAFAVLPPLTSFALYFVAVHAPPHIAHLLSQHPDWVPRVHSPVAAWWRAVPTTILTVLIGAMLWPFYPGLPASRLVGLTLQLLAAFTLPHMLLHAWLAQPRWAAGLRAMVPGRAGRGLDCVSKAPAARPAAIPPYAKAIPILESTSSHPGVNRFGVGP